MASAVAPASSTGTISPAGAADHFKNLGPCGAEFAGRNVVLLIRDPRNTASVFQASRRTKTFVGDIIVIHITAWRRSCASTLPGWTEDLWLHELFCRLATKDDAEFAISVFGRSRSSLQ